MAVDMNRMVRAYVKLRDARSALKKEFDGKDSELKAAQERLEGEMLRFLEANKMDSVRTDAGTFYRQEVVIPSAADWKLLYDFIRENDAFEMLERRITRKAVKEYMEANNDALPPGVQIFRKYEVNVRRS